MYMTRPLINDHHVPASDRTQENYIGMVSRGPTDLPQVVSCGPVGYEDHLCLNIVKQDRDTGALHLTCTAVVSVDPVGLARLKREGVLSIPQWGDEPLVVWLLKEPHK